RRRRLRPGLRKVDGDDHRLEAAGLVSTVAERLVAGVPTSTERHPGTAAEAEGPAFLIDDLEVALDSDGAVAHYGDSGCRHGSSGCGRAPPASRPSAGRAGSVRELGRGRAGGRL